MKTCFPKPYRITLSGSYNYQLNIQQKGRYRQKPSKQTGIIGSNSNIQQGISILFKLHRTDLSIPTLIRFSLLITSLINITFQEITLVQGLERATRANPPQN